MPWKVERLFSVANQPRIHHHYMSTNLEKPIMDSIPLAYVDPGTGTLLLQVFVAVFLGGASLFWKRIKKFFGFAPKGDAKGDAKDSAPNGTQGDESKPARDVP